jgi:hypothetical protein
MLTFVDPFPLGVIGSSNAHNSQGVSAVKCPITMKRMMLRKRTPSGTILTCTACSWWAPLMESDISAAIKTFDDHVCDDHPPLKQIEKPSPR